MVHLTVSRSNRVDTSENTVSRGRETNYYNLLVLPSFLYFQSIGTNSVRSGAVSFRLPGGL